MTRSKVQKRMCGVVLEKNLKVEFRKNMCRIKGQKKSKVQK